LANANATGCSIKRSGELFDGERQAQRDDADGCGSDELGHADKRDAAQEFSGIDELGEQRAPVWRRSIESARVRAASGNGSRFGSEGIAGTTDGSNAPTIGGGNAWSDLVWLPCIDGKARPTIASVQPLVDGLSFKLGSGSTFEGKSRAAMLRAYGNAIVAPLAAEFIMATMQLR
jgi:DNA (cytosine-5)-methyltransferase 1